VGRRVTFPRLTPSPLLPNFLLTPCAYLLFCSLVRPPPRKGKETAATHAIDRLPHWLVLSCNGNDGLNSL